MAMDEQEKRTWIRVAVIFVVFVVAMVATPPFGLYSRVAELGRAHSLRLNKEQELREKRAKVAQLDDLRARVAEAEDQIAHFERLLPNSPEAPELFERLKQIAWQTGLTFKSLDRLPPVKHKMYTQIPMKISMEVDYHGLGEFINRIENSDRFAKVDNIDVQTNTEDFFRQQVDLNLSTFIFTKPDENQEKPERSGS